MKCLVLPAFRGTLFWPMPTYIQHGKEPSQRPAGSWQTARVGPGPQPLDAHPVAIRRSRGATAAQESWLALGPKAYHDLFLSRKCTGCRVSLDCTGFGCKSIPRYTQKCPVYSGESNDRPFSFMCLPFFDTPTMHDADTSPMIKDIFPPRKVQEFHSCAHHFCCSQIPGSK